jgi:DNA polymerase
VKHFKFRMRGKRRIHQRPAAEEIAACRPWLEAELEVVNPELLVCLGATAAKALLGSGFRVTRDRGEVVESKVGFPALGTIHPSAILRAPDDEARRAERRLLTEDLRVVARTLG